MHKTLHRIIWRMIVALTLVPSLARAGVTLKIEGVNDELAQAIRSSVSLTQYAASQVTPAQVHHLYAQASGQARAALRPYGYYDPSVHGSLDHKGAQWTVVLKVSPGQPVIVRTLDIRMDASAEKQPEVHKAVSQFKPAIGQQMNDGLYTESRNAITTALNATGYLDAKMTRHKVLVTRATHSAAVHLHWHTGPRYRFGKVHIIGSQFRKGFLERYVPFSSGDHYSQPELLKLQEALTSADYFSMVDVQPDIEHAHNGVVDVNVHVNPAKRSVYSGGPFIGTDTGAGIRLGLQRRWVNNRGNKWKNELVAAQRLKTLSTLYQIPMPGPDRRSFNFGADYQLADTVTSHSHSLNLVANESRLWHGWLRTMGVHALAGSFTVGQHPGEPGNAPGIEHGRSTLLYPEISLVRKMGADANFVRHGWLLSLTARGTVNNPLSDTGFAQLLADAKWIHAFAGNNRLIVRADAGTTLVKDFQRLPPQLRFFAGGARSIRGYGYQAVGPHNAYGRVIGGRNLLVGSVEVEHYLTPHWGVATFVDAGNAFNGHDISPRIGTGIGLRWRSPVGMVRLDLGVPVHDPNAHAVHLHIVIGPDL
ncbi:autotransporter assembly complex family protein [Oleiagrimonas sp.]|jgi:translocation and assembly module TamA|uniref:autotransporter assembly complex protein TamA n=1 Tax=Oleiagrimonas sp. TaxID=2010330 RepID=UPI0026320C04|nr:autotransporter assembly complex family protein [Oleiagrimonas sp.]MDA3915041.1 autotransporter assembly complex protein TamA [Oleiagrimonas sp.]